MAIRIISALLGIPILLTVIYFGGPLLILGLGALMILGLKEFYQSLNVVEIKPLAYIGYGYGILWVIGAFFDKDYSVMAIFFVILWITAHLLKDEKRQITDGVFTLYAVVYIPFLLSFIYKVAQYPKDHVIWLVFLVAFATDTFAYFSGMLFGKRKLCPRVSPKKTIEGAIGGILGTSFVCGLFGFFVFDIDIAFIFGILGGLGSVVAQFGDLTASMFKRWTGIKDFGKIMPGHGGVLDRFDSILFTAPFVYYFLTIFQVI